MSAPGTSPVALAETLGCFAPFVGLAKSALRRGLPELCSGMRSAVRMDDGWHLRHVVRLSAEGEAWRSEWQTVEVIGCAETARAIDWVDAWDRRMT